MTNKTNTPKKKERISLEDSAASVQRTIEGLKWYKWTNNRGVKPGTKRGPYKPRNQGVIKDKNFIITNCKQCGQEFRYKRDSKRLKEYCSDACRQKHYRMTLKQKHFEKQQKVQAD
jgi:hypothetical protein